MMSRRSNAAAVVRFYHGTKRFHKRGVLHFIFLHLLLLLHRFIAERLSRIVRSDCSDKPSMQIHYHGRTVKEKQGKGVNLTVRGFVHVEALPLGKPSLRHTHT